MCGLPGAGKTTVARRLALEIPAVRLSPDEWLDDLGIDIFADEIRDRLETRFWHLARELLAGGVSVILESGFWTRHDRDEKRLGARALGARVELHYLDVPFDELCRRVSARPGPTADAPSPFTRELMTSYVGHFAVPDEQELALFDPPTRSKAE
jgi:predicted kinase